MHLETKLQQAEARYEELTHQLSDPSVFEQPGRYAELTREYDQLKDLVKDIREWKRTRDLILQNDEIIDAGDDAELSEMARQENRDLKPLIQRLESSIELKLIPSDPEDSRNCIMEIRAGTGGDEAAIFAGDLYEMYRRYADQNGWSHQVLSLSPSEKGGVKEIVFEVRGPDAYGQLKYESGVHRVQRVPETESQGRIHTSAATVAVLPEAEEVDIHLDPQDLRIDTFRSSGAGGQHVNKTDSAIRITHMPTGIVAECQQERSQHQNKEKALTMLRSRLYEMELESQRARREQDRRSQVSTGDRSAKIRTYNFPQGRLTDHRIGLTLYHLEELMRGGIGEVIQALRLHDHLERLNSDS